MNAPANSTALTVAVNNAPARHGLMRPVVKPLELIEAHKEAAAVIKDALEKGRDYGTIPGAGARMVLLKPGAERLQVAFGLQDHYDVVISEADHDRAVDFIYKGKPSKSVGLYRYVIRCTLEKDGVVVGEGMGSCSTMESKYVSRPRDCENTVLKMAKKRAKVDAILSTLSLSDRFTQDAEDSDDDEQPREQRSASRRDEAVEAEVIDAPKVDEETLRINAARQGIASQAKRLGWVDKDGKVDGEAVKANVRLVSGGTMPSTSVGWEDALAVIKEMSPAAATRTEADPGELAHADDTKAD